nr:MarR family transcriptional regulator [Thermaerobacter sp.]
MQDLEDLLLELVQALHRRMLECVLPIAREHDLSHMAMLVLRVIQSSPGETVSDLSRRTEIAKSHISNTVELLSQQGFVEKRTDPQDRRLVHLFPTARAQALVQALLVETHQSLSEVLDAVDPQTVASLLNNLREVLAAFEQHTGVARCLTRNEPSM